MNLNLMFNNVVVNDDVTPVELPALIETEDVDGLILAGMFVDERTTKALNRKANPVVLFESYSSSPAYSSVLYDNFKGAYLATEYLIRKGHRQIGFVGGQSLDFPSFRDRRRGYLQAITDYRIDSPYYADFNVYTDPQSDVADAMVRLVQANRQLTGLVCITDDTAIVGMNALREAGCQVPQDISVIGFDDVYMAKSVTPALTTMRVNKQSMGRLAVQILLNQVFQEDGGIVTSLFCPSLVERDSVRPVIGNEIL